MNTVYPFKVANTGTVEGSEVAQVYISQKDSFWVVAVGLFVPDFIYNIGTTALNGGVSMVVFFFANKIIFPADRKE